MIFLAFVFPAILITGGNNLNTVELFLPTSGTVFSLPPLLGDFRRKHTVDNNILCGGDGTEDSCLQWSPKRKTWEQLLTLEVGRYDHVSWTPVTGSYLMGGNDYDMRRTTTLIKPDGTQEPGFPLKYDT